MNKEYYVYGAYLGDKLLYVGKGKGDRWKHCFKPLNNLLKDYCNLPNYKVNKLVENLTEQDALRCESKLIEEFNPVCNKVKPASITVDIWNTFDKDKITNEERLIEECKVNYKDASSRGKLHIFNRTIKLIEYLTPKSYWSMFRLINLISRRNVLFIQENELVELLNSYDAGRFNYRSVKKILIELRDMNVLVYDIPEKRKGVDNPRRIVFNPYYVWKGDLALRG